MRLWRVPYPKFGAGPGLDRVSMIAERLGIDLAGFGADGAVIVGSNGKGSTAAMTAALLAQVNPDVGLFTSPHLVALNERFRIGDEDIGDDELETHWERVAAAAEATGQTNTLGGFEFLFLIAADWFTARGCAHTVWEAGIGGRLDPVRLIAARRLALTSLDLEHTALLGDTLEAIAREKIDAAPLGARLYVSESCEPQRAAIEAHCTERGVSAMFVPADPMRLALLTGAHQRRNAALALALARDLAPVSDAQVDAGFSATRWPGRLEVINQAPLVVIDVGHTPAAIDAALAGFQDMKVRRDAILVCGASHDKDPSALVARLAPHFSTIICAAARHKGAPAAEVAAYAVDANGDAEIVVADSVAEARRLALARGEDKAIYVAGGLFLAAEFKAVHLGRDPALLAFF
ncbi:MAG: bifunctional folylpolyglutamate synthase/dihydrofolate synthase [Alphaproteobacteria bacterium]|nr:MAG: bifunctional folylpolyglutamate synthase/dihydrofolate synthase [Alphaproteobacteria bacterium]